MAPDVSEQTTYETLIDNLLKSGQIDYAKYEPVADDADAVAALVREAVGRNMLAALEARIAGIKTEG